MVYVVDTTRSTAPATFISNMLYACRYVVHSALQPTECAIGLGPSDWKSFCYGLTWCGRSILYKTKVPMIIVFNKTDLASWEFARTWMTDFDAFQAAVRSDESYANNLTRSMGLVLDEFYKNLRVSLLLSFAEMS